MPDLAWKWSTDCGCYYWAEWHQPPTEYTLGDRLIYAHFGLDSFGIIWRGSTEDDWGGYSFSYDLGGAINWVRGANLAKGHYFMERWPNRPNLPRKKIIPCDWSLGEGHKCGDVAVGVIVGPKGLRGFTCERHRRDLPPGWEMVRITEGGY